MREALQRRPESFAFHYRRGLKQLRDGVLEGAVEDLREAARFNPNFADVHNYLGVACGELERWQEAIESFRRALEVNEEYQVARLNLAFALDHAGQTTPAIEELRAILSRDPENQAALAKLEELQDTPRERTRVAGESNE
jgi:lipoprotein NlpI